VAFIRAFVRRDRRDRYLSKLVSGSQKGRRQLLDRLNHRLPDDLDSRLVRDPGQFDGPVAGKSQVVCHIIADEEQYDGKDVSVADAFAILRSASFGVIVSFIPGKLACYKGEAPSEVVWLVRNDPATTGAPR
jgi:hypothetical protein